MAFEFYRDPALHALAILESVGDLESARNVACGNARRTPLTDDEELEYWVSVELSLMPNENREEWN
jgi:hypothetical protein